MDALKKAGAAVIVLNIQAEQAELDKVVHIVLGIYGGIDVLVKNAAYAEIGVLEELRSVFHRCAYLLFARLRHCQRRD